DGGAVLRLVLPDRRAEPDRELDDAHPEPARRDVMAPLVHDHENREPEDGDENVRGRHYSYFRWPRRRAPRPDAWKRSGKETYADGERRPADAHRKRNALGEVISAACVKRGPNARRGRCAAVHVRRAVVEGAVIDREARLAEDAPPLRDVEVPL